MKTLKHHAKRWLSSMMALVMLISCVGIVPVSAAEPQEPTEGYIELGANPAYTATVYVSAEGDDSYAGTADAAVLTLSEAYKKLAAKMGDADADDIGCIVVSGTVDVSASPEDEHDYIVHITGEDENAVLNFTANHTQMGPVVYGDITLKNGKASGNLEISGAKVVTIETGVQTTGNIALYGANGNVTGDTWVLIKSGTWRNVYAGNVSNTLTGNANLKMTGGTVNNYLLGAWDGTVTGNVSITLAGDARVSTSNGLAGTNSGTVGGNVSIALTDDVQVTAGFLLGSYTGTVSGNVSITLDGNAQVAANEFLGTRKGTVGDVSITLAGNSTVTKGTFGAGAYTSPGTVADGTVVLSENATLDDAVDFWYDPYGGHGDINVIFRNAANADFAWEIKYRPTPSNADHVYMEATSATAPLVISGVEATSAETFTGGGKMTLDGATLTITESVSGSTAVSFPNPEAGVVITAPKDTPEASFTCATEGYELVYANGDTATWTLAAEVAPTLYTVSVDAEIENGTVTASPTSAAEGDTVTLTVTPNQGYELETLTVKDGAGEDVPVSNNSFTMPASAVTVSATFAAEQVSEPVEGYIELGENLTYKATVYVSATGNDEKDGLSAANAVATLSKAYAVLKTAMTTANATASDMGRIVVSGEVSGSGLVADAHDYIVHIMGNEGTLTFNVLTNQFVGPMIFSDITLKDNASGTADILAKGPMTMGKNITTSGSMVLTGSIKGTVENDTWLLVESGDWSAIYAGAYQAADTLTGNVNLKMTGGTVKNVAASYAGKVIGDVNMTFAGNAALTGSCLTAGGYSSSGKGVDGDSVIVITENATIASTIKIWYDPYGANGNTKLIFKNAANANFGWKFDNESSSYGHLQLEASSNEAPLVIATAKTVNAKTFVGGGKMTLDGAKLNITESVTGTTAVSFGNAPTLNEVYITAPAATADGAFTCATEGLKLVAATEGDSKTWTLVQDGATLYTVAVADNIQNGTVTASPTSAVEGATVTLTAQPAEGYALASVSVVDGNGGPVTVVGNKTFTMPASNVTVSATFEEADVSADGYIVFNNTPTYKATVYVSATGDDNAAGTEQAPVKTLSAAYAKLDEAMTSKTVTDIGRIVVAGTVDVSAAPAAHDYVVHITGSGDDAVLNFTADYTQSGPTVYDDLTLKNGKASGNLSFAAMRITVGENVETSGNIALYGTRANATGTTWLLLKSGEWYNVYVGSYNNTLTGSANLKMTGGAVNNYLLGSHNGAVTGNVSITLAGDAAMNGSSFAHGGYLTGSVGGGSVVLSENATISSGTGFWYIPYGAYGRLDVIYRNAANANFAWATRYNEGNVSNYHVHFEASSDTHPLVIDCGDSLTAETFTGGGKMVLGGAKLTITGSVTGETEFTVTKPINGKVYITAPKDTPESAFTYVDGEEGSSFVYANGDVATWTAVSENLPSRMTLYAPTDVTMNLYAGIANSGGTPITPNRTYTQGDDTYYVYEDLGVGSYSYRASGTGYYNVKKNIYYSAEKKTTDYVVNADPGRKESGDEFQQSMVSSFNQVLLNTDEFLDTVMGQTWPDSYNEIFDTPYFRRFAAFSEPENRDNIHRQTTHAEMLAYLDELDAEGDNMYVYFIGKSPMYEYDFPVVVFTKCDLSGAETLEEAAAIVNASGKPEVMYEAQIHSSEPAATEGALAMANQLDGAYGNSVLDKVDVIMVPRINPDGAHQWRRTSPTTGDDMNRDWLNMGNKELHLTVSAYNLFEPEAVLDAHEYLDYANTTSPVMVDDMMMTGNGGGLNNPWALNELGLDIMKDTLDIIDSAYGLRGDCYSGATFTRYAAVAGGYYSFRGSISFLMETRGINVGMEGIERRVMSQFATAKGVIDLVAARDEEVLATVAAARAELIEEGATYRDDDLVILKSAWTKTDKVEEPTYNIMTGEQVGTSYADWDYYMEITRSRIRPTAYVLPADLPTIDRILEIATHHSVDYYALPDATSVKLQQYKGNDTTATLTEESAVFFENGAYVFPMNQNSATILAMVMEPDVNDSSGLKTTLPRMGLVSADADGYMPIYRYCYDLVDGKITVEDLEDAPVLTVVDPVDAFSTGSITGLDANKSYEYALAGTGVFAPVEANATAIEGLAVGEYLVRSIANGTPSDAAKYTITNPHITECVIYVDGTNGNDANNGLTDATAVKTLLKAYEVLIRTKNYAPNALAEGKIVFVGTLETTGTVTLPEHDFPVLLTGATASDGFYTDYNINFHGPTTLDGLTVSNTATLQYLVANGHDFTIGENVTCTFSGGYGLSIVGGSIDKNFTGDTNVTIKGGSWNNVHGASRHTVHTYNHIGNANLTVTGGTIQRLTGGMFYGPLTGNVNVTITGGNFPGTGTNGIYASGMYGTINGNVTLTIAGAASNSVKVAGGVYGGLRNSGSVNGNITVNVSGAEVGVALTAGNKASGTISGTQTLNLAAPVALKTDVTANSFNGGLQGALTLNNAVLTVTDQVTGSAVVQEIAGAAADESKIYIITPANTSAGAFAYAGEELVFAAKEVEGAKHWYLTENTYAVTGVTLDKETLSLYTGENDTLVATVIPANASDRTVSWTSSNPEVATVADGVVTAVAAGTATITVTTTDGSLTATCAVTVVQPVTGVTLDKETLSLTAGGNATLVATVAPANASDKTVSWTSSNPEVATVADGVVTAVAAGTATITVTTEDGGFTDTCTVTVTAAGGGNNNSSGSNSGGSGSSSTTTPSTPAPTVPEVNVPDAPKVDTSSPTVDSKTETNADGSSTKTETKEDGTTVETTTKADGSLTTTASKTEVKENADGSTSTTTSTNTSTTTADGSKVTEEKVEQKVENKDGSTTTTVGTKTETQTADGSKVSEEKVEEKTENADGSTSTTVTTKTEATTADGKKETVVSEEKTTENADGSATKTTTVATQTENKSETTVKEEKTVVNADGTTTTTETAKTETALDNGSKGTTTVDETGKVEAEVTVTNKAVTEAAKSGDAVALPMPEVPASTSTESAPVVKIDLPAYTNGSVKVEVPVENVGGGVVAVIVNADGSETMITDTIPTENGISVPVEGDVEIKIVDKSVDFDDLGSAKWAQKAVDFNSARGIMNGTGGDFFNPAGVTTRATVWTMLARLSGVDTSAGATWDEVGRNWAMENGISDGTNGNAEITREQLATMLYRFVGSPAHDHEIDHFDDHHETSSWAREGKEWAVGNKIINGKSDGGKLSLDPTGDASRAEVAQIFMNFLVNVGKN